MAWYPKGEPVACVVTFQCRDCRITEVFHSVAWARRELWICKVRGTEPQL